MNVYDTDAYVRGASVFLFRKFDNDFGHHSFEQYARIGFRLSINLKFAKPCELKIYRKIER